MAVFGKPQEFGANVAVDELAAVQFTKSQGRLANQAARLGRIPTPRLSQRIGQALPRRILQRQKLERHQIHQLMNARHERMPQDRVSLHAGCGGRPLPSILRDGSGQKL